MAKSNFLPTEYQSFIHLSRYSRWLPDKNRRETWDETEVGGGQYSAIAIGTQNTSTLYVAGRYFPNGEDCEDEEGEDDCTPEKNSAIFISNDFGASWTKSSSVPKGVFKEIELEEGQELEEEDIVVEEEIQEAEASPEQIWEELAEKDTKK